MDGGGGPIQSDPGLSMEDIYAAFKHYKSIGKHAVDAVKEFAKDYGRRIKDGQWSPESDAAMTAVLQQLYTGPGEGGMMAVANIIKQAANEMHPKVNEQQPDQVKVKKEPLGKNTDSDDVDLHQPKKIKTQHPPHDVQLTKNKTLDDVAETEDKDVGTFGAPKPKSDGHVPAAGDQPGTKPVRSKDLGRDSDTFGPSIPHPKVTHPFGRND
jgi:hypothetical protein